MDINVLKNSQEWKKEKLKIMMKMKNSKYDIAKSIKELKKDIESVDTFLKQWEETNSNEHIKIRKQLEKEFPQWYTKDIPLEKLKELKKVFDDNSLSDTEKDVYYCLIMDYSK
jgi:hypothetical protein